MKAAGNPYRELTDEQQELYMNLIFDAFGHFKRDILLYRPSIIGLNNLSDGRGVSGSQALDYKLVDELGSRSLALKHAAMMGGIEGKPEEEDFSVYSAPLANLFTSMGYHLASGFRSALTDGNGGLSA
jgi:ClpP class serine protease